MPRGFPDYQSSRELAVAYQTVWEDDFEAPHLKWIWAVILPGLRPSLVTTASWKGVQSMYFDAPLGIGPISGMLKHFPLLKLGRIGVEFWIRGLTLTPGYFDLIFDIFDGTNQSRTELRVDFQADTISIITPLGPFVIDTPGFPGIALMPFVPIKIVVDTVPDTYTKLFVSGNETDISGHSLVNVAPTGFRYCVASFNLRGNAFGNQYAWLDNFILTQNEP